MADPEEIYQEVLKEEQGKGVSPAVSEGRAKAAQKRAEEGSPHPKEPRWWPGAQPHLEGGEAGDEDEAPAEEAAPEEAAPAQEPAAAAPVEEAPASEATADKQTPEATPDAAPAPAPAAAEPAAPAAASAAPAQPAPAPQPAAAAAATSGTIGVSHGTATGTRLRPEDEVTTEAQFEGQKAMYERRKLIDELVATGVPQVSASDTDRPRSPWLAVLYLLIPIVAIIYLSGRDEGTAPASPPAEDGAPAEGGGGASEIVAANTNFNTDTLTLTAGETTELPFSNEDTSVHNLSIYPDQAAAEAKQDALFTGPDVAGSESTTYEIDPLDAGTYAFICDFHTNMQGEVTVE